MTVDIKHMIKTYTLNKVKTFKNIFHIRIT